MEKGRPKAEIPRKKHLSLRLTDFEFKKIEKIAKEKKITKTEAILQGIDLLIKNKPQKIANIKELRKKHGTIFDDDED